jgi:hypothetical protein
MLPAMAATIKIDQATLSPAGTPGKSRTDGLAAGQLVTLTNTGGGSTTRFRLLWTPPGDTTAVSSLAATGATTWTFTPTAARYGTYEVECIEDEGLVTETRQRRCLTVRTPTLGLAIPAFNERADPGANLLNAGAAEIAAADNNSDDWPITALNGVRYAGWWRAWHELALAVDSGGGGGSDLEVMQDGDTITGGTGIDTLDFIGLDVSAAGSVATVAVRGPAEHVILDAGGDWIDLDLEAECPGIKPGDIVAIQTIADLTIHSIIPPSGFGGGFRCTLCFRNQSGGDWVVTILDSASPDIDAGATGIYRFRTPGAQFNEQPGPDYTIQSEEDAIDVAYRETGTVWFIAGGTAGQRGADGAGGSISKFDTTHSPVVLYNFEYNLNDSSGNGFTMGGGGTVVYREVWPGFVALVSNSAALLRAANDALLTITGDMTVLALVVMRAVPTNGQILNFSGNGASELEAENFLYAVTLPNQNTLQWFHESGAGTDQAFTSTGHSEVLPLLGMPFFVGVRRQSGVVTFFMQKAQPFGDASSALTAASGGTNGVLKLRVGTNPPELGSLAVYDTALSNAQIKALYNATIGPVAGFLA